MLVVYYIWFLFYYSHLVYYIWFPSGSDDKESAYNSGDSGSFPGSGRCSWRREWPPTPVFLPGESHGQRTLIGYSPWGRKESDMTEQLQFHFNLASNQCYLIMVVVRTDMHN